MTAAVSHVDKVQQKRNDTPINYKELRQELYNAIAGTPVTKDGTIELCHLLNADMLFQSEEPAPQHLAAYEKASQSARHLLDRYIGTIIASTNPKMDCNFVLLEEQQSFLDSCERLVPLAEQIRNGINGPTTVKYLSTWEVLNKNIDEALAKHGLQLDAMHRSQQVS